MSEIKGDGFNLRHIKLLDVKEYFECSNNREARKGFMSTPKDIDEAKKEVREHILEYNKKKPEGEIFAIEINGEFAGWVEISHLNREHYEHKGSVGYCIHPKFRGKGIATKAVKLIVNYAFKKYKLKRIEGWCRTFNKASARVLEKAGFRLEGILRKNKFRNGEHLDDMLWAKVR